MSEGEVAQTGVCGCGCGSGSGLAEVEISTAGECAVVLERGGADCDTVGKKN